MSQESTSQPTSRFPKAIQISGAFKHNEEIMQAILAQSTDAILSIDQRGKIRLANPAAHYIFGLEQGSLLGRSLAELVPAAKPETFQKLCLVASDDRDLELVGKRPGEQRFPIDFALSEIQIGDETFYTAIIRDITERTKLRLQLQEQVAKLEVANKELAVARDKAQEASALKSMFVANISHEIRTPMSGVLGMSELLLMSDLSPDDKQIAAHIFECSKNLVCIVNDLLDFSKLEAGKVRLERLSFSLANIIEQVIQTITPAVEQKGLKLTTEIAADVPEQCIGDDGRIRQTLLNLAHNAVKFTCDGTIHIGVTVEQLKEETAVVKIRVVDSGIGISEKVLKSLFTPFMQADNSMTRKYGGTGLGLSICKSLVALMSGQIGVDSIEGQGSTFWVQLPLERSVK
jgi:PAS domain S-box-containing protein